MCTHSSWASFRGIRQVKRRTVEALEQVGQPWKLMERCASSHRKTANAARIVMNYFRIFFRVDMIYI